MHRFGDFYVKSVTVVRDGAYVDLYDHQAAKHVCTLYVSNGRSGGADPEPWIPPFVPGTWIELSCTKFDSYHPDRDDHP